MSEGSSLETPVHNASCNVRETKLMGGVTKGQEKDQCSRKRVVGSGSEGILAEESLG